jgi:hypothetical protein
MTLYSGGPEYYAVYRGPNVWLRIEATPKGAGGANTLFFGSGAWDAPTELFIYIDGKPAFHAGNYRDEPQFYQSFNAAVSVDISTEPINTATPTSTPESQSTAVSPPASTQSAGGGLLLPLAALTGVAVLLGLTRKKRR